MSSIYKKVEYETLGNWGCTETKTLYCWQSNTSDTVTVADEEGKELFCYDDTIANGFWEKLKKLIEGDAENDPDIKQMSDKEISKIFRPGYGD